MTFSRFMPRRPTQVAWLFWVALAVIVGAKAAGGDDRTVSHNYRQAAERWIAGEPLYQADGQGFLYLPTAALAYAPLVPLPHGAGELFWRLFSVGLFAAGLRRLASLVRGEVGVDPFPLMTLVALPITWSAARNGQSTLPMAGLMMVAAGEIAERRWSRTAALLALAVAFKPLAIVMALLAGGVHRRLRLPLLLGLAAVAALPFLTQRPGYVSGEYAACVAMLRTASDFGFQPRWAQVFSMLAIAGVDVPAGVQTAARLAAAVGTLGLTWLAVRRWPARRAAAWTFGLSALYLVLFNPRTENNTYCLAAPAIGALLAEVWLIERRSRAAAAVALMAAGILGSYELGKLVTTREQSVWLAPLMGLAAGTFIACRILKTQPKAAEATSVLQPETRRAA